MNCHGLEYSLSSVADQELIEKCFQGQPTETNRSVKMAVEWFEAKKRKRDAKKAKKAAVKKP